MNPVFPLFETVADGEPHIFNDRLYIYGSHDENNGTHYCPKDYVLYSCSLDDLNNWQYHGVIYRRDQDPRNSTKMRDLYAPDAVEGNDGRYYLYYFVDGIPDIAVAVADKPEGPFEYYGTVSYPDNISEEELKELPVTFDPTIINDNGHIYLAYGFSVDFKIDSMDLNEHNTKGAVIVELEDDMLKMKHVPKWIIPGKGQGKGTSFEKHEFLEASSIRKYKDHYYFIYSSQAQHELCYAIADDIYGPYTYAGILISNAKEDMLKNNWANNHGSIVKIKDDYYIFYHRHTHGTQFSRQECVEKIEYDGLYFKQTKPTSGGFEGELKDGEYSAAVACFLYDNTEGIFLGFEPKPNDVARIEQDRITNIRNTHITYRYFKHIKKLTIITDGLGNGNVRLRVNNKDLEEKALAKEVVFAVDMDHAEFELHFDSLNPFSLLSFIVE